MTSNIKVLQVIPKLGYGGAETGCYDIAHYLPENNCKSFIVTSGGELIKFVDKKKVKIIRLPVHSKNPILILFNAIILVGIILIFNISIVHARSRAPAWSCLLATKLTKRKFVGSPGKYQCVNGCDKNTKGGYFTGKEPSPKGMGYCARCTPLNIMMKGKDGNLWENKKYSKGKRWVRV